MWLDRFNLGPNRDENSDEEQTPETLEEEEAQEPTSDIPYTYEGMCEQLFKVNLFMTAIKESGETSKVRIPLTVPDFDMGALCEILHWNGIPYNCIPIEPEEGEEDDES